MIVKLHEEIDLQKIADSGQCFRWQSAGEAFVIPHRQYLLRVRQLDPFTVDMDCDKEAFESVWHDYFDLGTSYRDICLKVPSTDRFLCEAIADQKGIRILRQDTWEMLITSIITQNRNIPAIRKSVQLLSERAGTQCQAQDGQIFFAFPTPDQINGMPDALLASCKLGYREKYVRSAAHLAASDGLDLPALSSLPDEECMERLMDLPGVGPKVACCILLFGLHRLNAFPVDVWVRRILSDAYPAGYPAAQYAPYNGVYQQYMFEYYRKTHS